MSTSDDNYTNVLLEQIRDQNNALLEAAADQATRDDITQLRDDVQELKADVKTIKAAVTDLSGQVGEHERRITHLETRTA
jgi:predicted  nucleic acid-binding Zn-ribbon protein